MRIFSTEIGLWASIHPATRQNNMSIVPSKDDTALTPLRSPKRIFECLRPIKRCSCRTNGAKNKEAKRKVIKGRDRVNLVGNQIGCVPGSPGHKRHLDLMGMVPTEHFELAALYHCHWKRPSLWSCSGCGSNNAIRITDEAGQKWVWKVRKGCVLRLRIHVSWVEVEERECQERWLKMRG